MATKSIGRWLILLASAGWLGACGPKVMNEPPQTAASVPTEADAGLQPVPLTRRGVIVPSDVELQPPPKAVTAPTSSGVSAAPASPGAN